MYYRLKGQALAHLVAEGVLAVTGLHRFGGQHAELVEGAGFRFHRPCPAPAVTPEGGVPDLGQSLESRPRKRAELGVRAAVACVREYLDGKPELPVYQWPAASRGRAVQCWNCGGIGHLARDCWEDDEDECDDEDCDEWDDF